MEYGGEKCWMEYTENPRKPFFLLVLGKEEDEVYFSTDILSFFI
jgi:hypothetical protein